MIYRVIRCAESGSELRNFPSGSRVYLEELTGSPVKIALTSEINILNMLYIVILYAESKNELSFTLSTTPGH